MGNEECEERTMETAPSGPEACKPWTRSIHIPGGDFKTSTGYNHRYIHPISERHQVLKFTVPKELKKPSVHIKESAFETTYGTASEWKYNEADPVDRANKISLTCVHYISPFGERMKINPPNPPEKRVSEYHKQYPPRSCLPKAAPNIDFGQHVICKIQGIGRDEQPSLKTSSGGFMKHLDPYITTSHLVHHAIAKNEADKYKHKKLDYVPTLSPRIKPIYDVALFKLKYTEKRLPKTFKPVPHTGMETEMKSSFRLPFDEMTTSFAGKTPVFMRGLADASKADILATPAMYLTEYNQLGRNWKSICS